MNKGKNMANNPNNARNNQSRDVNMVEVEDSIIAMFRSMWKVCVWRVAGLKWRELASYVVLVWHKVATQVVLMSRAGADMWWLRVSCICGALVGRVSKYVRLQPRAWGPVCRVGAHDASCLALVE
ncbi:hypothetical protein LIER_17008 [Lithospermum erythrorhizon]|uniref:Uncharacterized protein n=1 Tax=Lithospermum erythrorhizon TaxID=34254 RepID=A0AAV3Q8R5_LITER